MSITYCFDSSAFINSWSHYYPPSIFPTLWSDVFPKMISEARIIIPLEVRKEILNGNDSLVDWIADNCPNVVDITSEQLTVVQEIVVKYPRATDYKKPRPNHADPFVVAVARMHGYIVVTDEGNGGSKDNPRIPFLCKDYGVECVGIVGFLEKESIKFRNF